jgi:hypothetical protein
VSGFEGLGSALGSWAPDRPVAWTPGAPVDAFPDLVAPPKSTTWSRKDWERFVGISMVRHQEEILDRVLLGTGLRVSWERAEELHDRVQVEHQRGLAEARALETRRYWSGPSKIERQILKTYQVTARQIGLDPKSVFTPEFRRRQRARVKRRRR